MKSPKQTLSQLRRDRISPEDIDQYFSELEEEGDRSHVLAAAAFVDRLLVDIISEKFVKNVDADVLFFNVTAPLGSFSSRVAVAHPRIVDRQTEGRT